MDDQLIMYFFVNQDLYMSKGKTCSQVAHCCQTIVEKIIRSAYQSRETPLDYLNYMKWKQNCVKIILKATTLQLLELQKLEGAEYIIDNGATQVAPDSLTVVGFPPSSKLNIIAKKYKLL